jgi:hypothetical protein
MGIRDRPISPGSPWQNGIAERLIGTLRRECLDRMLIFGGTCGASFLRIWRITIRRARTWHCRKMRPCTEQSNGLVLLLPFRSWPGCIMNMPGYNFRKGQGFITATVGFRFSVHTAGLRPQFFISGITSRLAFTFLFWHFQGLVTSALPAKADIGRLRANVRSGLQATPALQ